MTHRKIALLTLAVSMSFAASLANGGTMSSSPTPPVINGSDIANLTLGTGTEKWWAENTAGAGSVKGQTFTTGGSPVVLRSITYQVDQSQKAEPTKTYVVRVGTVSGSAFSQIHTETFTQNFTWKGGEFMTWTFDTPVLLSGSTTYGIDVGMTNSTSGWQTGIPYLYRTGNAYSGGVRYSSGTWGVGTGALSLVSASDFVFHLDLEHPLAPSPEDGARVPAGEVILGWSNLTPTVGSDVWVDVWFGTDSNQLTKVVAAGLNKTSHAVTAPGADDYFWRIDSYLGGSPTGTPTLGTLFKFIVVDSDGDGFPDEYELLHTDPPSATGLNREDDLDLDGLNNWDEFLLGTSPTNPDSDGDSLLDGGDVTVGSGDPRYFGWVDSGIRFIDDGGARTFRGEAAVGTDPLKVDTDGDGLPDGVETNTGIWVGPLDTGTDPTNPDTDRDGLPDGVETNTGVFVSMTNTGTHPHMADTDDDGAGDWYEIAGSLTNPFDPTSKPVIPYPLPGSNGGTGVSSRPVKVYIMSGQSNMVGFGRVGGIGAGTLATITNRENKFPNLPANGGGWAPRTDVKYRGVISAIGNGDLVPGFGANTNSFGPELGFGQVMGWHHDEPVLLIKASIGNRGLGWDFLPPGTESYPWSDGYTYAGYGLSGSGPGGEGERWLTATGGPAPFVWYAGKQFDDSFRHELDMSPRGWGPGITYPANCQVRHNDRVYLSRVAHTSSAETAPLLDGDGNPVVTAQWDVYSVFNTVDILDHFGTEYPQWADQGFEIAGYVWWQGHRDQGRAVHAQRYEQHMVRFIKQLRQYYADRYPGKASPEAPFVLATIAFGGWGLAGNGLTIANAQLAVDGDAGNHPEFADNVKAIEARHYYRNFGPSGEGEHYLHNAETYLLTGDALGRAMVELQQGATQPSGGYAEWAAGVFSGSLSDPNPALDFDGGGLPTAVEWVVGGDPTLASDDAHLAPAFETAVGPDGKVVFTFRRSVAAQAGATLTVQYGSNLTGWLPALHQGGGVDDITITEVPGGFGPGIDKVSVALPAGLAQGGKLFARLHVIVNQHAD